MDDVDLSILRALQANARISNADMARELGMAPSAVLDRVRKLEQHQIILGYEAKVAPKEVGLGLTAFLFVQSEDTQGPEKISRRLADIPEVLEVHNVAGEDCFLIKLRVRDTDHLAKILRERIRKIPKVRGTRTTIVLETLKESSILTLAHAGEKDITSRG